MFYKGALKHAFIFAIVLGLLMFPHSGLAYMVNEVGEETEQYIEPETSETVEEITVMDDGSIRVTVPSEEISTENSEQAEGIQSENDGLTVQFPEIMGQDFQETLSMSAEEMEFLQLQFEETRNVLWSINTCLVAMACLYLVVHYSGRWVN